MAVTTRNVMETEQAYSMLSALLGMAFARVLVPLYFLAGAVLKIIDASPTHLPTALIKWAGAAGIDL
ncbi:MAG: hypothetical protein K8R59_01050, partial [Thermoanaerobaculales bacterium]|nr:hypothetical protein [Thermoanaerobaculales bacterium]